MTFARFSLFQTAIGPTCIRAREKNNPHTKHTETSKKRFDLARVDGAAYTEEKFAEESQR